MLHEFVLLIGEVIWPGTILYLSLAYRKEIVSLLARVKVGKALGTEFEFTEVLDRIVDDVPVLNSPEPVESPGLRSGSKELEIPLRAVNDRKEAGKSNSDVEELGHWKWINNLAVENPPNAILESWLSIEKELSQLTRSRTSGRISTREPSYIDSIKTLSDIGAPSSLLRSIDSLRGLRNQIVHNSDMKLSFGIALTYIEIANTVINDIRNLGVG